MPHNQPQSCDSGCCGGCFACTSENWYARCCQWYGYPESLAQYMSGLTLNFGPLERLNNSGYWFSNPVSIPGTFSTDQDQRVTSYVNDPTWSGTPRVEGTARVILTLSNVKIRLVMRHLTEPFNPPDCRRIIFYQLSWTQTITDIPSCWIVVKNIFGGIGGVVNNPAGIRRLANNSLQVIGLVQQQPFANTSGLFDGQLDGILSTPFQGRPGLYSDDCDFVFERYAGKMVTWPGSGFFSANGYYLPAAVTAFDPPAYPLYTSCFIETPQWLGTGATRIYPATPYSSVAHLLKDTSRPPLLIKRGTSWPICAVNPVDEAIQALNIEEQGMGL